MKTFRSLKIAAVIGAITTGMNSWGYPIYILTFEDSKANRLNPFVHDIASVEHDIESVQSNVKSASSLEAPSKNSEITFENSFEQDGFIQGDIFSRQNSSAKNALIAVQPVWLNSLPQFSGNARKNNGEKTKLISVQHSVATNDLVFDLQPALHEHLINDAQSLVPSDHKVSGEWVALPSRDLPTSISQGPSEHPAQAVLSNNDSHQNDNSSTAVVSEPGTLNLICVGAVGLALTRRFAKSH